MAEGILDALLVDAWVMRERAELTLPPSAFSGAPVGDVTTFNPTVLTSLAANALGILPTPRGHNGGPPDLGRVDDGISEALASRRGIGRACLAAYGDAALPQITDAIGRGVKSLDEQLTTLRLFK